MRLLNPKSALVGCILAAGAATPAINAAGVMTGSVDPAGCLAQMPGDAQQWVFWIDLVIRILSVVFAWLSGKSQNPPSTQ
jgi:hypothetical protein